MHLESSTLSDILNSPITQIILTIIIALLVQAFSHRFIERIVRRTVMAADRYESKVDEKKREDTVIGIFRRTVVAIIWLIVILIILTILKVNIAALVTGAGLFGVIIGLGAQNTIKDYLAGFYILSENQYRVGDIVTLSGGTTTVTGTSGVVEEVTLRITKLRDQDGTLNIVRNGEAGIITNRTFKYSNVVVDVFVGYDADIDTVEKVINKVGMEMLNDPEVNKLVLEPIKFLRVENFTEAGVQVKSIGKVRPASQYDMAGKFRRQLKEAFAEAHLTFGVPKRNLEVHERHAK